MINFKKEVSKIISNKVDGFTESDIEALIEIPPSHDLGDYALPCFKFAKTLRKSPNMIAEDLTKQLEGNEFFEKIENTGSYINFFVDQQFLTKMVLEEIREKGEDYGRSEMGNSGNVTIDYSSPNIAKSFHVGHLRSTVIGNSLYKIYDFLGFNPIGINHLGDWGTQFGKMIYAYKEWGDDAEIEKEPIKALQKLYVKFHDECEKDENLEDKGREWFKKLEDGDEEAKKIWKWFIELSLEEFSRIYKLLNVEFDYMTGESFYEDKMARVVEMLDDKGILMDSEGAKVVDLEKYDMPPCLIIKSNGTTIYATRDVTAAIYRKETFDFVKSLYVTDYAQSLHFSQVFKVIKEMGYDWSDDLIHVPFGRVSTEEGKLQTRKGNVILLDELVSRSIEKVKETIEEKNPDLMDKDEVARKVGVGAIIFNDLSNGRIKDIVFNWERMLSFEGETGPYVQYTYVRAKSVLRKAGIDSPLKLDIDYKRLEDEASMNVVRVLSKFQETVIAAMEKNEPSFIARFVIDLAQSFSRFYHDCPIIVDDKDLQDARLMLVSSVATVLKTGLMLLGIEAPEKM